MKIEDVKALMSGGVSEFENNWFGDRRIYWENYTLSFSIHAVLGWEVVKILMNFNAPGRT